MDGVHDMGGMHGFGPVDPRVDHVPSKSDWRGRMFGIELSFTFPGGFSLDWIRHVAECIPPAAYLEIEYYDRWYRGAAAILVNAGWASLEELEIGKATTVPAGVGPPLPPQAVSTILRDGMDSKRPAAGPAAFSVGDTVKAKLASPLGHIRLPRYVRGHIGQIEALYGWHALPDAGAAGEERAEPLYNVSFLAHRLWDEVTSPSDRVCVDLWESYLEPA
jgi:nitrile hydratase beta subunit